MRTLKASLALILLLTPCLAQAGWVQQKPYPITHYLGAVHFIDNQTGYAVGWFAILKTTNGGTSWTVQDSSMPYLLNSVHFPSDANTGYAVGVGGKILKSTDDGETWIRQNSGITEDFMCVNFPSNVQTGYVVGLRGSVLKTTDGGMNWSIQSLGAYELSSVHFPTGVMTGYIAGATFSGGQGTVFKTTDGGGTWIIHPTGTYVLSSVHFPADDNTGYAVGGMGSLAKTNDGGATWLNLSSISPYWLRAVYFPTDANTGYIVGDHGTIFKTVDGGASWINQSLGSSTDLYGIHFPENAQTGYAVGDNGFIIKTTDGGTWVEQMPEIVSQRSEVTITATPNPFTSQTLIRYQLSSPSPVRLSIYNISGQLIKTLAREVEPPGLHTRRWDGRDEQGKRVAAGVYFYRLVAGGYTATNKIILLR